MSQSEQRQPPASLSVRPGIDNPSTSPPGDPHAAPSGSFGSLVGQSHPQDRDESHPGPELGCVEPWRLHGPGSRRQRSGTRCRCDTAEVGAEVGYFVAAYRAPGRGTPAGASAALSCSCAWCGSLVVSRGRLFSPVHQQLAFDEATLGLVWLEQISRGHRAQHSAAEGHHKAWTRSPSAESHETEDAADLPHGKGHRNDRHQARLHQRREPKTGRQQGGGQSQQAGVEGPEAGSAHSTDRACRRVEPRQEGTDEQQDGGQQKASFSAPMRGHRTRLPLDGCPQPGNAENLTWRHRGRHFSLSGS